MATIDPKLLEKFRPSGGAGFLPAAQVPTPADTPAGATFMGDVGTAFQPLADIAQAQRGPVSPQPQVPTMESLGGRTPQFGNFEVSSTPSILPTATSPQPVTAPVAQAPATRTTQISGMISRGGVDFAASPMGPAALPEGEAPVIQQGLQMQRESLPQFQGLPTGGNVSITPAPAPLTGVAAENVAAGRPANVSAAQAQEAMAFGDEQQRQLRLRQLERDLVSTTSSDLDMQRDVAERNLPVLTEMQTLSQQGEQAGAQGGLSGLNFDQALALRKQQFTEQQASSGLNLTPAQKKRDESASADLFNWDSGGRQLAESNIKQLQSVITDLSDGQVNTRAISDFLPASDLARSIFNPTGQDALDKVRGVIFQSLKATLGGQFAEKEGTRLVEAAYNPKLTEQENIARLSSLLTRTQAAATAKSQMSSYMQENGTLRGYSGPTAQAAFQSARGGAAQASGSPIEGDVDVPSAADALMQND